MTVMQSVSATLDAVAGRKKFNNAHPGSLLARTIGNPELKRKYDEWRKRHREDSLAMERWARSDFQSGGATTFSQEEA